MNPQIIPNIHSAEKSVYFEFSIDTFHHFNGINVSKHEEGELFLMERVQKYPEWIRFYDFWASHLNWIWNFVTSSPDRHQSATNSFSCRYDYVVHRQMVSIICFPPLKLINTTSNFRLPKPLSVFGCRPFIANIGSCTTTICFCSVHSANRSNENHSTTQSMPQGMVHWKIFQRIIEFWMHYFIDSPSVSSLKYSSE